MAQEQLDVEFNGHDYSVYGETDIVSAEGKCGVCGRECSSSTIALVSISEILNAKTQIKIKSGSSTWQAVAKKAAVQYKEEMDDFVREEEGKSSLLICNKCDQKENENMNHIIAQDEVAYKPRHKV